MTLSTHLTNADAYPQFIVSKIVNKPDGTITKHPCNPHGIVSSHKDPSNWMALAHALAKVAELNIRDNTNAYRLGFSITKETKLFFYDMDNKFDPKTKTWSAFDPDTRTWSPFVNTEVLKFPGGFIEVSQSGTGLHILGRYTGETPGHRNKNSVKSTELYTHDRYIMFSGNPPVGDWNVDATASLHALIASDFLATDTDDDVDEQSTPTLLTELTDEKIIQRARKKPAVKAVLGDQTGASFNDLYDGNFDKLAIAYPTSAVGEPFDRSRADLALANMLGNQGAKEAQIMRIMRTSALMRDKYDRGTYLLDTAVNGIPKRPSTLSPGSQSNDSIDGSQVLSSMPQDFEDCYYVLSAGKIFHPTLGFLTKADFNVCYGGRYYPASPLDPKPTSNAYKSFEGHAEIAGHLLDTTCFRPDLPSGQILLHQDQKRINIYRKPVIKRLVGDAEPFFKLLRAAYPNERDQQIILSYMARNVQSPGIKANWVPVLQGGEGIGKSTMLQYVAHAVGKHYVHSIRSKEFESGFNEQWYGKVLLFIEDPKLRKEKLDDLIKTLITETEYSFEKKGEDCRMADFPANLFITTNDKDLIRKTANTRRYSIFLSALQTEEQIFAAGLTNEFFEHLGKWNRQHNGYEIVNEVLHTYEVVPEFDYAGVCTRAPNTSTTLQAIAESKTELELILIEEIELQRIGFKDGWMSSVMLNNFLLERKLSHLMPFRQRGQILEVMGYVYHPALYDGRCTRNVQPDNTRPRLFIKKDHPHAQIRDREEVLRTYEESQKKN